MIPILDLKEQYQTLKREIDGAIQRVLESGIFIMGPNVEAFESEIGTYLGARHAISLNSGTDALHLAMRALGIGPGDEVITTPFTFVATTEAVGIVGATPVFVDIDPQTFNIDPTLIERAITPRTKAILPIHMYGAPAAMPEIVALGRKHGLAIVEDCAQAIGAEFGGRKLGTFGEIGCFSFFPSKNLGAYGDGGLVATNDDSLAEKIRALRVHGGKRKYHHEELGINSRLDEIQAAILRVKLPHLEQWILARRELAARYTTRLQAIPSLVTPSDRPNERHVYHQYTIRVDDRDRVKQQMAAAGVQTMIYYPVPLHMQQVHKALPLPKHSVEHSERASRQVLSLPMYPELSWDKQDSVMSALRAAVRLETPV